MTNLNNAVASAMTTEIISTNKAGEWVIHTPQLTPEDSWFDHQYWLDQGRLLGASSGRGSAWMVKSPQGKWMLRHYFRGGLPARIIRDRYIWQGLEKTRAVAEWRLLQRMSQQGLPVPQPVAARVQKKGFFYTADILMQFVLHEQTFTRFLNSEAASGELANWQKVGRAIGQLHGHGYFHADLNAHNILLSKDLAWLIDFDRGRYLGEPQGMKMTDSQPERTPLTPWQRDNLKRLRRSIQKVTVASKTPQGTAQSISSPALDAGWTALMDAYHQSRDEAMRKIVHSSAPQP